MRTCRGYGPQRAGVSSHDPGMALVYLSAAEYRLGHWTTALHFTAL